jgi:hypothetical protein
MPRKKEMSLKTRAVKARTAARQSEPFEGKNIGRTNTPFRGSEQRGPGMNKGRGSTGGSINE